MSININNSFLKPILEKNFNNCSTNEKIVEINPTYYTNKINQRKTIAKTIAKTVVISTIVLTVAANVALYIFCPIAAGLIFSLTSAFLLYKYIQQNSIYLRKVYICSKY